MLVVKKGAPSDIVKALAVDIDDPQRPYIDEAMVRLCKCLKRDFTPYIATVLPPILYAAEKSDITITDSKHPTHLHDYFSFFVI